MMSETAVVEEMLDVVSKYGRGEINLWEAVLRLQHAGSTVSEEEIIDALGTVQRQNVVQFPRKEE